MSEQKDGGPAFPNTAFKTDAGGLVYGIGHAGMPLRDWFAGQANVAAYFPSDTFEKAHGRLPTVAELAAYIAQIRYSEADAMIAERAKAQAVKE